MNYFRTQRLGTMNNMQNQYPHSQAAQNYNHKFNNASK